MKKLILISLLVFCLCSCEGRRFFDAGESALTQRGDMPGCGTTRMEYERAMPDLEQKYNFTTEELIRLENIQLHDQLTESRIQTKNAVFIQRVLLIVIAALLTFIFFAWMWWRGRERYIQKLYDQARHRHKSLEKLQLAVADPIETATLRCISLSGHKKEEDGNKSIIIKEEKGAKQYKEDQELPLHYPLLYRKLNHVMKERELFLDPDFELATMSQEAGISRTIISNVLNRHAGMSFNDWLSEYRINYLLEQIKLNPGIELSELYPKAGYTTRSTFFRQFRNVTGLTPMQYMCKMGCSDAG